MSSDHSHAHAPKSNSAAVGLSLGALGVVFGDIGTSPLYAMKECLHFAPHMGLDGQVLGILSLITWLLIFIVCFKYLFWITRADNRGEGGIFALLALTQQGTASKAGLAKIGFGTVFVLAGAALLYGDGIITPAISVLGAVEGLETLNPKLRSYIVPIAVGILVALFAIQFKGTKTIGRIFGPVMMIWFTVLGALGIYHMSKDWTILRALNPVYGFELLKHGDVKSISALLGAVVLSVTGAEALYADMGHFGRRYIAYAWYFVAMPGLLLNYYGQGSFVLSHPEMFQHGNLSHPFFSLATNETMRIGLVFLACAAAVIASQALISGTYSLTQQAIQLGYFPRMRILHTNAEHIGQIYLPFINLLMAIGAILVVIYFKSSTNLAAAYGIAVTGTMVVTTYAFYRVAISRWKWPLWKAASLCGLFMLVDIPLFAANFHKIADRGWVPLAMAAGLLLIMYTWKKGRNEIVNRVYGSTSNDVDLPALLSSKSITRIQGSSIFMVATPKRIPLVLLHHLKVNRCLHETVVLMTIMTEDVPSVDSSKRLEVENLGAGVWSAVGRYGYMETPNVTALMKSIEKAEEQVKLPQHATPFFFNREMIILGGKTKMWPWEKKIYAFLSRNATPIKDYYQIRPSQIVEIGLPVQL